MTRAPASPARARPRDAVLRDMSNGRAAGSLTSPNVAGMFRFHTPSKWLKRSGSTLTATVTFKPSTGAAARRLTFRLVRCPRVASAPPFTG